MKLYEHMCTHVLVILTDPIFCGFSYVCIAGRMKVVCLLSICFGSSLCLKVSTPAASYKVLYCLSLLGGLCLSPGDTICVHPDDLEGCVRISNPPSEQSQQNMTDDEQTILLKQYAWSDNALQ